MKRLTICLALIIPILFCTSWGFFAHKRINHLAVFTLPASMMPLYKKNIKYLTEHAVDPDKRRYADTLEAPRHYLDVENYEKEIDSIPEKWNDALAKYGQKKLNENGIVPWQIQRTYYSLVKAFKTHDSLKILKYSAWLGHYIGDAHVPLHTTNNHNGQLSNQVGIHAFWESRLPELFSTQYNYVVGKAIYIENPLKEAWKILKHTHGLVDSVLTLEAQLNKAFPSDQKYSFSERNNIVLKQYSIGYSKAYQDQMNSMVEKQMRNAILEIGSFWYSAWVDAGQPELKNLKLIEMLPEEVAIEKEIEKKYQNNKLIGREL
ncbi:zinc dependent phospholipase C family protein [Pedobacter punctiformis]|uniref:Zinc dependent phospholipase C family protein n=1 Tax=Pedobacter punctiformis TaxID=3004097 RepID=A0ABT4L9X3_9SPHI|nr:zinc dependent phospholipase C family protein [Pedobacter sp. HCMS5-2]MCZ4244487.1 zinc dependent phospholipase C family protein [Pedobacter sp. HCMS5-2]